MFPIGDEDEGGRAFEPITLLLIVANIALFLVQLQSEAFTYGWSLVPFEVTNNTDLVGNIPLTLPDGTQVPIPHAPGPDPIQLTFLSSMFLHGGWLHIGGNMLYLWIFGDNVERALRTVTFVVFYLITGFAASFAQIAVDPASQIPNLGASGAISGVLGAYLVLFPGNRVRVLTRAGIVAVPALLVIGLWALLQFVNGFAQIAASAETGGVAFMAHVGGFVTGVVLAFVLRAIGLATVRPTSPFAG